MMKARSFTDPILEHLFPSAFYFCRVVRKLLARPKNQVWSLHQSTSLYFCIHAFSCHAVAYLLMSIFPILTASTTDNKAYLQPLRHLYVLSTRQRITDCISIRSSRYIDEPLQTPSEGDGPRVVYVPGDLGDPTVIHAIRRSFEGRS
jgi:hypothetical protein